MKFKVGDRVAAEVGFDRRSGRIVAANDNECVVFDEHYDRYYVYDQSTDLLRKRKPLPKFKRGDRLVGMKSSTYVVLDFLSELDRYVLCLEESAWVGSCDREYIENKYVRYE